MAGAKVNSSNAGIKGLVYAVLTEPLGVETYGTIVQLPGLINFKISPKVDSANLYSDNSVAETSTVFTEADLELELQDMNAETQADFFGHAFDPIKGTLTYNVNDTANYLAVGYERTKTNGKSRFVWLMKTKFEPIDNDDKTKENKASFGTTKLKGKAIANKAGVWKKTADEDSLGSEITDFLTEVGGVEV